MLFYEFILEEMLVLNTVKIKNDLNEICLKTVSICIFKEVSRHYHGVKNIQKVEKNIADVCSFDCFPRDCIINISLGKFDILKFTSPLGFFLKKQQPLLV